MPVQVVTFQDALAATEGRRRHLLLGNGFSIALFPNRFRYGSLLEETDFARAPEIREAFDRLQTTDFEVVINALKQAIAVLPIYLGNDGVPVRMSEHVELLKDLLVQAIAGLHPERPSEITEDQYAACRAFLAHFVGDSRGPRGGQERRGQIYTLNYDLLLYWTLLHDRLIRINPDEPFAGAVAQAEPLKHDDGFRAPDDEPDAPYVTWDADGAANTQNVHFLHGALHLFDSGPDLQKKCWERAGGVPLIDQIRAALAEGKFPLFVSEGDTDGKLTRIRHSGYLDRSLRSFTQVCQVQSSSLFIFGHSLAPNDNHVLRKIGKGGVRVLYVSLHGDPESAGNRAIVARTRLMVAARQERRPLDVHYFDATSADVWG